MYLQVAVEINPSSNPTVLAGSIHGWIAMAPYTDGWIMVMDGCVPIQTAPIYDLFDGLALRRSIAQLLLIRDLSIHGCTHPDFFFDRTCMDVTSCEGNPRPLSAIPPISSLCMLDPPSMENSDIILFLYLSGVSGRDQYQHSHWNVTVNNHGDIYKI